MEQFFDMTIPFCWIAVKANVIGILVSVVCRLCARSSRAQQSWDYGISWSIVWALLWLITCGALLLADQFVTAAVNL
jgi:hypothetical protein